MDYVAVHFTPRVSQKLQRFIAYYLHACPFQYLQGGLMDLLNLIFRENVQTDRVTHGRRLP